MSHEQTGPTRQDTWPVPFPISREKPKVSTSQQTCGLADALSSISVFVKSTGPSSVCEGFCFGESSKSPKSRHASGQTRHSRTSNQMCSLKEKDSALR